MQLPELFGSSYITLALIVVVVLLIFLLIIRYLNRRRERTKGSQATAAEATGRRAKRGAEAAMPGSIPQAPEEPAPEMAPPDTIVATAPPEGRPAPGRQAPAEPREALSPTADPVQAVVTSILQGWGDLATEDTNRLALFRRDRVLAVIAAVDLPKDLKDDENMRTRLSQLRRWAASLEHDDQGPAQIEFAAIGHGAWQTPGQPSEPVPAPAPEAPPAAVSETPASVAAGQPAEPATQTENGPEAAPELDRETLGPAPAAQAPDVISQADESAAEVRVAERSWGAEEPAEPPVNLWGTETADTPAETQKPPEPVVDLWGTESPDIPKTTEEAVAAAAAAFWARPEAPKPVPQPPATPSNALVAETPDSGALREPIPASPATRMSEDAMSGLGERVSTAAELLALPAGDRADMLAFLDPGELNKVFRTAQDPGLKKSVIDTLEHVRSPAALDVLRECLDDPDPEIQMYALEAADRLLGAG